MADNSSLILWILKNFQNRCPHPDKFHLEDELTDKQLNNIFKGLGLPLLYDKVLAFWDNSTFLNCKAGVLFVENGCYFSRKNKPTYYIEYSEICYCVILENAIRFVIEPDNIVTIPGISAPENAFLQELLTALKTGSPKSVDSTVKRSGPVKDIKDLISKKDYNSCLAIIHGAAVACGGVGVAPTITMSDVFLITPIQVTMLIALGNVFNVQLTKATAYSFLASFTSAAAGRNLSRFTIGMIPGIGNAVNAATAASLIEAIGWMFVRNYALNKTAALSFGLNNATQLFEDKIKALSAEQADRFIASMERLSEQSIARSPEIAKEVFFKTLSEYSVSYHVSIEEISLRYVTCLKDTLKGLLKKSKSVLADQSQAQQYYQKFASMEFSKENLDFELLTDFVELFLGLYNQIISADAEHPVHRFSFDLTAELPNTFFNNLSNGQKMLKTDKETLKKKMVYALTSLIYGYAVDRERTDEA